jgi:hypothetical protein
LREIPEKKKSRGTSKWLKEGIEPNPPAEKVTVTSVQENY